MKKRIEDFVVECENLLKQKEIKKGTSEDVLIKIHFFQHERLIHLMVTFLTGIATILFLLGFLYFETIPLLLLFILSFCLFVPYIFHYYTLENNVQKLYDLYFKIKEAE